MNELLLRRNKLLLNSSGGDIDGKYRIGIGNDTYGNYYRDVYRSIDYGKTWKYCKGNLRMEDVAISATGQWMMIAGYNPDESEMYIYSSNNFGENWKKVLGLDVDSVYISISATGQYQVVSAENRIYISKNYGEYFSEKTVYGAKSLNEIAISDTGQYMILSASEGLFVSNDYGEHWKKAETRSYKRFNSAAISADGKYQIATNDNTWLSTNYGDKNSWDTIPVWVDYARGSSISASGQHEIVYSTNYAISNDYGKSWETKNEPSSVNSISISGSGQRLCVCTPTVYDSKDFGKTWTPTGNMKFITIKMNRYNP